MLKDIFDEKSTHADVVLDGLGRVVVQNKALLDLITGAQGMLQAADLMPDAGGCGCNGGC